MMNVFEAIIHMYRVVIAEFQSLSAFKNIRQLRRIVKNTSFKISITLAFLLSNGRTMMT